MVQLKASLLVALIATIRPIAAQYFPATGNTANSLLLTETRVERPIIMHKHQLLASGSYGFYLITSAFDNDGKRINYRDEGIASSLHAFNMNLHYGINEWIELNAAIGRNGNTERRRDMLIAGTDFTQVTQLTEHKGFTDLDLGISLRPFPKQSLFDAVLEYHCSLPTASSSPAKPEHSALEAEGSTYSVWVLNYHYFSPYGKGVPYMKGGGALKFRLPKSAVNASFSYGTGTGTGKSSYWTHQLVGTTFHYNEVKYNNRPQDEMLCSFLFDYQMFKWFDLFAGASWLHYQYGWKEIQGVRYKDPEMAQISLHFGFEIMTTEHIRILQSAKIGLTGQNYESENGFSLHLVYTLFTSK